ncbi:MAG: hypothetical protein RLZZ623_1845, partial [Actinomycetota bacterium]
ADDLDRLEEALLANIGTIERHVPAEHGASLSDELAMRLFDVQMNSRHIDHAARWLRSSGIGYYTIGSAGHESNALVAAALRPTDPALLHYRSGGFYLARAAQVSDDPLAGVRDVLAGMLALIEEPISGGRHKVFGHPDLDVIPQTSTIASHLPRAVGVAFAIERAQRLGVQSRWSEGALAVCSFGDASANHSTAQGALNAAAYTAHGGLPLPLLFVCEDNGLGISVPTPKRWIESMFGDRAGLRYAAADGTRPGELFDVVTELAHWVRTHRRPAVLHLRTVRFMGHAGTDVEAAYRSAATMRAELERDPLLAMARLLVERSLATPDDLCARYLRRRDAVRDLAMSLVDGPTLENAEVVMETVSPRRPLLVAQAAAQAGISSERAAFFGTNLPEAEGALTLAETINRTLGDVLVATPEALVFGEDVAVKGGVYGVTRGLAKKAGSARVFDTLLDEQSILGLALGAGVSGLLPIPEIQYLAYLHNAEDQLRGEAASLSFFSQGSYRNPLVVRIAGLGYQKGFGGHFHNDNSVAVLRDIPGLVVASPGHPADAAPMLRSCVAAARIDGTVSVFLEPIALYHTRDLYEPGDGAWTAPYRPPDEWADAHVPIGEGRVVRDGDDLLIVTWANGMHLAMRAARRLAARGVSCRIFDLRWLAPLPLDAVVAHAIDIGRVLVVDETRRSGGVGEALMAALLEGGFAGRAERIAARDTFIPLGDAANTVLVSEDDIVAAAHHVLALTPP